MNKRLKSNQKGLIAFMFLMLAIISVIAVSWASGSKLPLHFDIDSADTLLNLLFRFMLCGVGICTGNIIARIAWERLILLCKNVFHCPRTKSLLACLKTPFATIVRWVCRRFLQAFVGEGVIPPTFPCWCLRITYKDNGDEQLGDVYEHYTDLYHSHGHLSALIWVWHQWWHKSVPSFDLLLRLAVIWQLIRAGLAFFLK